MREAKVISVEQALKQGVTPSSLRAVAKWNEGVVSDMKLIGPEKRYYLETANKLRSVANQLERTKGSPIPDEPQPEPLKQAA